jgi:hypothetical protein
MLRRRKPPRLDLCDSYFLMGFTKFLKKIVIQFISWLVRHFSAWAPHWLYNYKQKQYPWSEPASELYRPSDRRLSAKLAPTFADRGCHVVIVTDPYGRILGFLGRSRYFSSKLLSIVLTRLSEPYSRPSTSQKTW